MAVLLIKSAVIIWVSSEAGKEKAGKNSATACFFVIIMVIYQGKI
jgi:hypothetical protein